MTKQMKKGFTLTELIVVIAIMGILAAVLLPALTIYIEKSKMAANYQEAMNIKEVVDLVCVEGAKTTDNDDLEITLYNYTDFENIDLLTFYQTYTGKTLPAGTALSIADNFLYYTNRNIPIKVNLSTLEYEKVVL